MRSCLLGLPDGSLDLGACGEAYKVNACTRQVGVFVDDVAFTAALHTADVRLATPAAHADANALVGSDKANEFLFIAKEAAESKLQLQYGRWYLSAAARQTALDAALEAGLDVAYARPFSYLEPHGAIPGNAASMRNVAADAVLAELESHGLRAHRVRPYARGPHPRVPRDAPRRHQCVPHHGRARAVSRSADVGRLRRALARLLTPRSRSNERLVT